MKKVNIIAGALLTVFFLLALFSVLGDSNTMDEVAHTPAGYSYIVKQDMRLNPEHPPLLKDLAGLSIFLWSRVSGHPIAFNDQNPAWRDDVNGQWSWGFDWLFRQNRMADRMVLAARLPMLLLGALLGWYIFRFGKEFINASAGLLALFFYAFSPTFLAHTRLVTTDVGAALGFFVAIFYFLKWYKEKSAREELPYPTLSSEQLHLHTSLVKAGIAFGIAQLIKFSAFLLIPYFVALVGMYALAYAATLDAPWMARLKEGTKRFFRYLGWTGAIIGIGYILVFPVYSYHIFNYPPERQRRDTSFILTSFAGGPAQSGEPVCNPLTVGVKRFLRCPAELTVWASNKPTIRAYAQYMLGLLMVIQRATGGNTTYFLGEVSAAGWKQYFPAVYLLKETLALHILTLGMALAAVAKVMRPHTPIRERKREESAPLWKRLAEWIKAKPALTASLWFIAFYWIQSVRSNLNIGVRHVLPTFPFIFLLVARELVLWLRPPVPRVRAGTLGANLLLFFRQSLLLVLKYAFITALLLWMAGTAIAAFPYYLSYFNGLVGTDNGYRFVVDSNYDWGQDLKRLRRFVENKKIDHIKVYYFGGSPVEYYLGSRYEFWDPARGPTTGWIAVSATLLQGGRGAPAPGFHEPTGYFNWLNQYEPTARAGKTIFIYYIPN